jgi:hypothetical protein
MKKLDPIYNSIKILRSLKYCWVRRGRLRHWRRPPIQEDDASKGRDGVQSINGGKFCTSSYYASRCFLFLTEILWEKRECSWRELIRWEEEAAMGKSRDVDGCYYSVENCALKRISNGLHFICMK